MAFPPPQRRTFLLLLFVVMTKKGGDESFCEDIKFYDVVEGTMLKIGFLLSSSRNRYDGLREKRTV
jgi:hypothetical protein